MISAPVTGAAPFLAGFPERKGKDTSPRGFNDWNRQIMYAIANGRATDFRELSGEHNGVEESFHTITGLFHTMGM